MKYLFYNDKLYEIPDEIWLKLDKKLFKLILSNNNLSVRKTELNTVGKTIESIFGKIEIIIRGGSPQEKFNWDDFAMINFKNPITRYTFREFLKNRDIHFESFE
jgi:hypothetical protein